MISKSIYISKANYADLEAILQLQKDCYMSEARIYNDFKIPPLTQNYNSIVEEYNNGLIIKAMVENEIVGSVRGFSKDKTCYIGKLIVKKQFQNRGIGKALMDSIEQKFADCNRYELFTGIKSKKNLYLYNKLGYIEFRKEEINEEFSMIYLEKTKDEAPIAYY